MAREIAIPGSIAGDLAVAASKAVEREQNSGRDGNASDLAEAAEELIHAAHEVKGSRLVSVDRRYIQVAAAFDQTDGRIGANAARAFLENAGVWDERSSA